ncbi:MAG: transporter, family, cyanate transporter [Pseudonocardiales bacterium]|nr:transporter, family, cyanate transporter [Pseudonocardiales bacterium]
MTPPGVPGRSALQRSRGTAALGTAALGAEQVSRRQAGGLIVVALILTGFTMRSAVTSVGPVLTELRSGLGISSGAAGLVTTLPVLCFAAIGSNAPRLAHRFGFHRVVVFALAAATAGVLTRAFAGSLWLFVLLSVLALAGGAIANVLMPSLVKQHFPDQIGRMTAAYTTALAVGMTASAGLTVPISDAAGSWRFGLGCWAVLSGLAILPWLPTLRADKPDRRNAEPRVPMSRLIRSRTAWALTVMFAFQSMQAYISFGWFPEFFRHEGLDGTRAGLLVSLFAAMSIPVSLVIPALAVRRQRPLIAVMVGCAFVGYCGLVIAPVGGAWLWMALTGIGAGMFPLSLTMLGLRSRLITVTSALSAFAQTVGYLIAGTGPLLVGFLLDITGDDWTWPFVLLFSALLLSATGAWYASRDVRVDDEITV